MNHIKLHRGNFPDPEFYGYMGTYGDWKAYATRETTDGIVKLKLVSMAPVRKANLFLVYNLNLGRFVFCETNKYFRETYPSESIALDDDMKEYIEILKTRGK